jgi:hydrogenase maturation protease
VSNRPAAALDPLPSAPEHTQPAPRAISGPRHFLTILGLGNILLQDEGFGVHFVRWFAERYTLPEHVNAVDGGTLGFGLFDTVTSCRHLIVIDALKVPDAPGSVYRFTQQDMELAHPPASSAHEVEFVDVLCKATLIDQAPEVIFLCIVPAQYATMQIGMTPLMRERFEDMERLLLGELTGLGVQPVRKRQHA